MRSVFFMLAVMLVAAMSLSLGVDFDTRNELPTSVCATDSPDVVADPITDGGDLAFSGRCFLSPCSCMRAIDNGRLSEPLAVTLIVKARHTGHNPMLGIDFGSGIDNGTLNEGQLIGIMWGARPRYLGLAVLGPGIQASPS